MAVLTTGKLQQAMKTKMNCFISRMAHGSHLHVKSSECVPVSRQEQQLEITTQFPRTKQKLFSEILDKMIGKAQ
ncbi:TPA: hypothetical protein ACWP5X_004488 [Escherichia coli]